MIRKLRNKIIFISFASVCVVFLMGLAVLLGIGYARLNDERVARLDSALSIADWHTVKPSSVSGIVLAEYDPEAEDIVFTLKGDSVTQTDEYLDNALRRIAVRRADSGTFGLKLVYSRRMEGDLMRIALYDRDYNHARETKYTIYTLIALLVGSACYLLICYFLAKMALRAVEVNWQKQKQFVADASHELKTPLAVIRANTDIIASHKSATVASQLRWIENTRFETERMTALVNDLLFLAKNDEGLREESSAVDMSDLTESVVLAQEVLLYEGGKTFSYEISPHMSVLGNDGQLKQLVTILLDNALKYSSGEGNITLRLSPVQNISGRFAELKVGNDCNELTEEQTDHLFDRFYTVESSRDKAHTGSGLGLAIAQAICENHNGEISVRYVEGRITFTALLPLNRGTASKNKRADS